MEKHWSDIEIQNCLNCLVWLSKMAAWNGTILAILNLFCVWWILSCIVSTSLGISEVKGVLFFGLFDFSLGGIDRLSSLNGCQG